MPSPSNESSVGAPTPFSTDTDTCDPSITSCAPVGEARAGKPNASITLDPVPITGDLRTQELVERFSGTDATPDCSAEEWSAAVACGSAAGAALCGVASAATIVGLVGGVTAALTTGLSCGKDLALLEACEQK